MPRETFKKIITSKENSEQILPKNRKLINQFLKEKDRSCSDKTILGYASDLEIFFTWNLLYNDNHYFPDMKKREISEFFSYCTSELRWGGARFSRMRSLVSVLSDYIVKYYDEEYPNYRNFVKDTIESMPKAAVREKTVLKEEDVNRLLCWLKDDNRTQEACFLSLAINSGARISELLQFKVNFIDENRTAYTGNMFLETTEYLRAKGRGKVGHRLRKYIIKDAFLPYFKAWIEDRDKLGITTDYLFVNTTGKPATTQTVGGWLSRWEKYLEENVYAHSFRHYFVTQLTRIGMPSDFIIEVMGWKTAEMYKIYNDLTGKDKEWSGIDILKKYLEKDDD